MNYQKLNKRLKKKKIILWDVFLIFNIQCFNKEKLKKKILHKIYTYVILYKNFNFVSVIFSWVEWKEINQEKDQEKTKYHSIFSFQ